MSELKKTKFDYEKALEIFIVVMLGLTALLMAWATWVGSLHAGNQSTSYTKSNNLASEGNSEYNAATQKEMQDMLLWSDISELQSELIFTVNSENPDQNEIDLLCSKIYFKIAENATEEFAQQISWASVSENDDQTQVVLDWLEEENATVSPFYDEEFVQSYYVTAQEILTESEEELVAGQKANADGDAFGLVTVIFSVVLFLLGIASTLKSKMNKNIIVVFSLVSFIIATIYMLTIPLPTGFSMSSFFGG